MGFYDFFSRQAGHPSGWFGRLVMAKIFDKGNTPLNNLMKSCFQVRAGDRILEIGCGTGKLIEEMVPAIGSGSIEGVEISETMASLARKRNQRAREEGRVIIRLGDFNQITFQENTFDTVCSCNTIYFWTDPLLTFKKVHSLLKPGGKILLAFEDKSRMEKKKISRDIFRFYSEADARDLLRTSGFTGKMEAKCGTGEAEGLCCIWTLK